MSSRSSVSRAGVWWLNPAVPFLCLVVPIAVLAIYFDAPDFLRLWRTPKYLETRHVWVVVWFAAAFTLGVMAGGLRREDAVRSDTPIESTAEHLRRAGLVLAWLALAGYLAWTIIGVARGMGPADIGAAFVGEPSAISQIKREYLTPVGGVSTFVQFGIPATACLVLAGRTGARVPPWPVLLLIFATILRAQVHGERLALIEVASAGIVAAAMPLPGVRRRQISLWRWFPAVAVPAVIVLFGIFEYFRSWASYYSKLPNDGYWNFVLDRLAAYYLTAMNNSALLERIAADDVPFPYFTLGFFWRAPGVSRVFSYESFFGTTPAPAYDRALSIAANPEFNNPGGLLLPLVDYGLVGGAIFWGAAGIVIGALYRKSQTSIEYVPLYAVVFLGLLEVGRYIYWTQGRATPAIIGAIAVIAYFHTRARQTRRQRPEVVQVRGFQK